MTIWCIIKYNKYFGGRLMGMGGKILEKDKRKIADFINDYVKKHGYNVVLRNKELNALYEENGVAPESVHYLNSDYCYNRTNNGMVENFKNDLHIFEYVKRGYYRLLGENYEYTGDIMHKPSREEEYVAGHWKDGVLVEWNPKIN